MTSIKLLRFNQSYQLSQASVNMIVYILTKMSDIDILFVFEILRLIVIAKLFHFKILKWFSSLSHVLKNLQGEFDIKDKKFAV